jgi:hypothetical protein
MSWYEAEERGRVELVFSNRSRFDLDIIKYKLYCRKDNLFSYGLKLFPSGYPAQELVFRALAEDMISRSRAKELLGEGIEEMEPVVA